MPSPSALALERSRDVDFNDKLCRFSDGDLFCEGFEAGESASGNVLRTVMHGGIKTLYGEVRTGGVRDGVYASVMYPRIWNGEADKDLVHAVSDALREVSGETDGKRYVNVLVCGLGNSAVLVDSMGPVTLDMIVTGDVKRRVYAVKTGTHGATGISSVDVVKLFCSYVRADLVICVDSLAARSTERIGGVLQITDSGMVPGSGVADGGVGLSRVTVGVPVISVGIPTVFRDVSGDIFTCAAADRLIKYGSAVIAGGINAFLLG